MKVLLSSTEYEVVEDEENISLEDGAEGFIVISGTLFLAGGGALLFSAGVGGTLSS